jgi:hypothetical protein
MDQATCADLDQTDEDIRIDTLCDAALASDEALEGAARTQTRPLAASFMTGADFNCC